MNILIRNGRVMDPARLHEQVADVAIADGRIAAIGAAASGFAAQRTIDATGCWVLPGLIDLAVRLGEPGREHEGMLASELAACAAGGITALVCPPDTDPVLDEPGLVEMLPFRAAQRRQARLFPLGALTRGLHGEVLSEMAALTRSGCVGFAQGAHALPNPHALQRALQYAATYGYTVWLRPQEIHLGQGVAASGPLATRLGLAGIPVAAETIALHTIFELLKTTGARVHLCRLSSAAGVALVRQAKADGLKVTCDVSIHSLLLTDTDIGYFDSRARLIPPLRQQRDREALALALADGTIDALVSDHTPVDEDNKTLPFAEAEPGATALELLLSIALKWAREDHTVALIRALAAVTCEPARVLGNALGTLQASVGQLVEGGVADICVVDANADWQVTASALTSHGKHTPFSGWILPGRVRCTLVGGQLAYEPKMPDTTPCI